MFVTESSCLPEYSSRRFVNAAEKRYDRGGWQSWSCFASLTRNEIFHRDVFRVLLFPFLWIFLLNVQLVVLTNILLFSEEGSLYFIYFSVQRAIICSREESFSLRSRFVRLRYRWTTWEFFFTVWEFLYSVRIFLPAWNETFISLISWIKIDKLIDMRYFFNHVTCIICCEEHLVVLRPEILV